MYKLILRQRNQRLNLRFGEFVEEVCKYTCNSYNRAQHPNFLAKWNQLSDETKDSYYYQVCPFHIYV
jgi:hypothetical protein